MRLPCNTQLSVCVCPPPAPLLSLAARLGYTSGLLQPVAWRYSCCPRDLFFFNLPASAVTPLMSDSTTTTAAVTESKCTVFKIRHKVLAYHNRMFFCSFINTFIARVLFFLFHSLSFTSDMGPFTSVPTQADTTVIQGNSYTSCFLIFCYSITVTVYFVAVKMTPFVTFLPFLFVSCHQWFIVTIIYCFILISQS